MTTIPNSSLAMPEDAFARPATSRNRGLEPTTNGHRWLVVVCYALSMAWVESAVVYYIRSMIDRIVPYQPNPLPIVGGFGVAEIVREAATLIMLLTVGWLAGRTWRSRLGFALLAFGVWDIGYYIWLIPLTGWPVSPGDWDILFLIPLPWWGPVWSPVSIALLMIVFGTIVAMNDTSEKRIWPGRTGCLCAFIGILLALWVFMSDSINVVLAGGGAPELRDLLPVHFRWAWFVAALLLMTVPVVDVFVQSYRQPQSTRPPFDHGRWLNHFSRNRRDRPEPDWDSSVALPAATIPPLLKTLTQFQLGDGGGPCSLIAFNAHQFRGASKSSKELVDAWFQEEAEHSRLLGCAVKRFGGKPITSHWSFSAFCSVRRWLGVRFELQVLLLTELVSTAYYRLLQRHVNDPAIHQMCRLILRDEGGHVGFHCDRLAHAGGVPDELRRSIWSWQFWLCGLGAATVLWVNHGPCLRPFGAGSREFYAEVRREIGGFIARLKVQVHELESRIPKVTRNTTTRSSITARA